MDIELPVTILPQPDNATCGPTCLHALLNYHGCRISLEEVIREIQMLQAGGTLAVFLACAALKRGFKATIYTYNLQMFDPSWFDSPDIDLPAKLWAQAQEKTSNKLKVATQGYVEFLELGGKLEFVDLTTSLIRGILRQKLPILTGLSATFLYRDKREYGPKDEHDDIRGTPAGHFVLLNGYHREGRTVLISDPLVPNPAAPTQVYPANIDRVICSILLGVLTHDANLLVIQPHKHNNHD
jgi:Peptidase_C39 like family